MDNCNRKWTLHDYGVHDRKHGRTPAGRAISEIICSSCAVYVLVTISGHVHGSGNSFDLRTRPFSCYYFSFRVLSQSGYFSVQQLATLATLTLRTPSFLV